MNEITLNSIDFNFEQLKEDVTTTVQQYVDFKVTSGTVSDAKKARAELNKLSKMLSDKRIEIKNAYMQPITEFENKVKLVDGIIKEQVDRLDRGVKEYEDLENSAKKLEIELFYQTLSSPVDLDKLWQPTWLNATVSETKWKTELVESVIRIKEQLAMIPLFNVENPTLLTNLYLETLDMTKAHEQYAKLTVDVSEQRIVVEEVKTEEPLVSAQIEILGTQSQIESVFRFMREHHIEFIEGLV